MIHQDVDDISNAKTAENTEFDNNVVKFMNENKVDEFILIVSKKYPHGQSPYRITTAVADEHVLRFQDLLNQAKDQLYTASYRRKNKIENGTPVSENKWEDESIPETFQKAMNEDELA